MSETTKAIWLPKLLKEGMPKHEDFEVREEPVQKLEKEGHFLVELKAISADPYLRGRIKEGEAPRVMRGFVVMQVKESNSKSHPVGQVMGGHGAFRQVQVISDEDADDFFDLSYLDESNYSLGLGVLGMPGSTAYAGLDILQPKKGETIFVSAAAGAVGSLVGQLAKNIHGLTVIGSCGGEEKGKLIVDEFGFDHAIDYKKCANAEELKARLDEVAPDGIDMYFENVGGMHFEAAFKSLRRYGRIAVCGCISQYNSAEAAPNKLNVMAMIYSFQRIEGFVCSPWLDGKRGSFREDMPKYWREGLVKGEETYFHGIEQWTSAFIALFEGTNKGKVVVLL